MKKLEKKVHFTAEGTSVGCYDSKGSPMRYILIDGEPRISLDFWTYNVRPCTNRELASFYLAKYKAQKNAIKHAEAENG